ncbi:UDP-N-acetylmuramoylalanine--D-glutamate ligase [Thiovulum sp. ES]|nr:UDP-N-acetylmuramoylalanine--D-glutamate ligase [Thiovulum sp. ES]
MKIYLLGYGKTTKAIAKTFDISEIYDDRAIHGSIHSDNFPKNIESDSILVPTPAVPPHNKIVENFSGEIVSEYDLFYKNGFFPYTIWVSGTNGKTTLTEMITHLLSDRFAVSGGNIGIPLGELSRDASIWVLETSSFTLHYTKYAKPNLYVLLPITKDHIDWHGSFKDYEESKLKPIQNLSEGEIAIIPEKYSNIGSNGTIITYRDSSDLAQKFGLDSSKISFRGAFLLDALLSLSVTKVLFDSVNYDKIDKYKKAPHRQEFFSERGGKIWIDDSKATNVESVLALLENYENRDEIYLILGGVDKGGDWKPLFEKLELMNVEIFGIGNFRNEIEKFSNEFKIPFSNSETIEKAVSEIYKKEKKGFAILSPACASFDQFRSYVDRGEKFKRIVLSEKF